MASDEIVFAVGAWLATYALHSTLLIGAASLVTALVPALRSNRGVIAILRERIWRAALVGGIVTASAQTLGGAELPSWRWSFAALPVEEPAGEALFAAAPPARAAMPRIVHPLLLPIEHALLVQPVAARGGDPRLVPSARAAAEERVFAPAIPPAWTRALVMVWIAGVLLGSAAWAREWIGLRRCLRDRRPLSSGRAHALLAALRRRSGASIDVRLSETPGLAAPITLGSFRAAEICLPPPAAHALRGEELEALLAHELAHAVRRDGVWLCVYRAISILFFFQPLNREARVRLQDEAEYLADDWAVLQTGERVALASCLTEIAGWIVGERRALPAPGMAARGLRLSLRVRRLLDDEHRPAGAERLRGASAAAAGAIAVVALFAPGISAADVVPVGEPAGTAVRHAAPVSARAESRGDEEFRFDESEPDAVAEREGEPSDLDDPPPSPLGAHEEFEAAFLLDELSREILQIELELAELAASARGARPALRERVEGLRERLAPLRALETRLASWIDEGTKLDLVGAASPEENTNRGLPQGGRKEAR